MDTKHEKPDTQDPANTATAAAARAIQADAGTTSAVEYLKALGVEASVIEDILANDIGPSGATD